MLPVNPTFTPPHLAPVETQEKSAHQIAQEITERILKGDLDQATEILFGLPSSSLQTKVGEQLLRENPGAHILDWMAATFPERGFKFSEQAMVQFNSETLDENPWLFAKLLKLRICGFSLENIKVLPDYHSSTSSSYISYFHSHVYYVVGLIRERSPKLEEALTPIEREDRTFFGDYLVERGLDFCFAENAKALTLGVNPVIVNKWFEKSLETRYEDTIKYFSQWPLTVEVRARYVEQFVASTRSGSPYFYFGDLSIDDFDTRVALAQWGAYTNPQQFNKDFTAIHLHQEGRELEVVEICKALGKTVMERMSLGYSLDGGQSTLTGTCNLKDFGLGEELVQIIRGSNRFVSEDFYREEISKTLRLLLEKEGLTHLMRHVDEIEKIPDFEEKKKKWVALCTILSILCLQKPSEEARLWLEENRIIESLLTISSNSLKKRFIFKAIEIAHNPLLREEFLLRIQNLKDDVWADKVHLVLFQYWAKEMPEWLITGFLETYVAVPGGSQPEDQHLEDRCFLIKVGLPQFIKHLDAIQNMPGGGMLYRHAFFKAILSFILLPEQGGASYYEKEGIFEALLAFHHPSATLKASLAEKAREIANDPCQQEEFAVVAENLRAPSRWAAEVEKVYPLLLLSLRSLQKGGVDVEILKRFKEMLHRDARLRDVKTLNGLISLVVKLEEVPLPSEKKEGLLKKLIAEVSKERSLSRRVRGEDGKTVLIEEQSISVSEKKLYETASQLTILLEFKEFTALESDQTFAQLAFQLIRDRLDLTPRLLEKFLELFSSEEITKILIYTASLTALGDEEKLRSWKEFFPALLIGYFHAVRYSTELNPHLERISETHPETIEAWQRVVSAEVTVGGGEVAIPSLRTWMKNQFSDGHLGEKTQFPALESYFKAEDAREKGQIYRSLLEGPQDENLVIQKMCIELARASELAEQLSLIKALIPLISDPSSKEFLQALQEKKRTLGMASKPRKAESLIVSDTDDPLKLLFSGSRVADSCQKLEVGYADYNQGLLGYLWNGQVREIVLETKEGVLRARAMLKLLWDGTQPVLLLERIYLAVGMTSEVECTKAIVDLAHKKADALGISLTNMGGIERTTTTLYPQFLQALGGISRCEYSDACPGVHEESRYAVIGARLLFPYEQACLQFNLAASDQGEKGIKALQFARQIVDSLHQVKRWGFFAELYALMASGLTEEERRDPLYAENAFKEGSLNPQVYAKALECRKEAEALVGTILERIERLNLENEKNVETALAMVRGVVRELINGQNMIFGIVFSKLFYHHFLRKELLSDPQCGEKAFLGEWDSEVDRAQLLNFMVEGLKEWLG